MTSLRTSAGINLNHVVQRFDEEHRDKILNIAQKFIKSGRLLLENDSLKLTKEGMFFADGIAGDLFV